MSELDDMLDDFQDVPVPRAKIAHNKHGRPGPKCQHMGSDNARCNRTAAKTSDFCLTHIDAGRFDQD